MRRDPRIVLRGLVSICLGMTAGLSLLILFGWLTVSTSAVMTWYGIAGILLIVRLCEMEIQLFGPAFILMLYTIVSHFGWPMLYVLSGITGFDESELAVRHLYIDYLADALALSFVACFVFCLAWSITSVKRRNSAAPADLESNAAALHRISSSHFGRVYVAICITISYIFALYLTLIVVRTGLLSAHYEDVKSTLGEFPVLAYLQRLFWVAFASLGALARRRDMVAVMPAIAVIATLLMASGNRNDILYPAAAAFAMVVFRRGRVSGFLLSVAAFVLFVVNPYVADARTMSDSADGGFSFRAVDSIGELGLQIRPLTIVMSTVGEQMPWMLGMTLVLPTLALVTGGFLWSPETFITSTYHIPQFLAERGHVGLGFSMIAEIWVNFGLFGTVVIYGVLGHTLKRWESARVGRFSTLAYASVIVLLIYWARNSLQFNAVILFYFLAFYTVAALISREKVPTPLGRAPASSRNSSVTSKSEVDHA